VAARWEARETVSAGQPLIDPLLLQRDHRRTDELRPATAPRPRPDHPHPRSHRYRLTETGLHHAMLLSHIHTRLLLPGLAC
jgi:hypothetical protein